jgi:hypothetical protein
MEQATAEMEMEQDLAPPAGAPEVPEEEPVALLLTDTPLATERSVEEPTAYAEAEVADNAWLTDTAPVSEVVPVGIGGSPPPTPTMMISQATPVGGDVSPTPAQPPPPAPEEVGLVTPEATPIPVVVPEGEAATAPPSADGADEESLSTPTPVRHRGLQTALAAIPWRPVGGLAFLTILLALASGLAWRARRG